MAKWYTEIRLLDRMAAMIWGFFLLLLGAVAGIVILIQGEDVSDQMIGLLLVASCGGGVYLLARGARAQLRQLREASTEVPTELCPNCRARFRVDDGDASPAIRNCPHCGTSFTA